MGGGRGGGGGGGCIGSMKDNSHLVVGVFFFFSFRFKVFASDDMGRIALSQLIFFCETIGASVYATQFALD